MIPWILCGVLFLVAVWVLIASFAMHLEHREQLVKLREQLLAWEMFREKFEALPEPTFDTMAAPTYARFGWRFFEAKMIDNMPTDPTP